MTSSFYLWNRNVLINELPKSDVKWTGLKFHISILCVWNIYFTDKVKDSRMKINFTYEIFISHMKLKLFTYAILLAYVRFQIARYKHNTSLYSFYTLLTLIQGHKNL